jgi:hypothetical protein
MILHELQGKETARQKGGRGGKKELTGGESSVELTRYVGQTAGAPYAPQLGTANPSAALSAAPAAQRQRQRARSQQRPTALPRGKQKSSTHRLSDF